MIPDFARLPTDLRFAAAVAGSAQLLRHDPYIRSFNYDQAIEIAQEAKGGDQFGYRNEFVQQQQQSRALRIWVELYITQGECTRVPL